ncbi:MAG: UvrD-helicase domain-containing protein, partial [Solirubrobacterales bacterium]
AMVTTIHGFCRRLLAAHPAAAGLDPRFRVLDQAEARRLANEAFERSLDSLAEEEQSVPALVAGFSRPRLERLVLAVHAEHQSRGSETPTLPAVAAIAESLEDAPEQDVEEIEANIDGLRLLIEDFGRRFAELKAIRSGLDFEDLQLSAVELLASQPPIRSSYRERFDHILVDEFQDTNPVQVALVHELKGPDSTLFTVGDEFQSIYGFRHADLQVFRAERERARAAAHDGGAVVLSLRGSFRSSPEVVAAVNAVGSSLLDDFTPLTVGTTEPPEAVGSAPPVELLLTERSGWEEDALGTITVDSPVNRVAEARLLSSQLRELAEQGEPRSGMVVLLRAFTHVTAYEDELRRAGLNPLVVGGRGYWSHQQVDDSLRLLACIANPLDDESLLGALASPAAGVSADGLMILRLAAGERNHLWPTIERAFGERSELDPEQQRWAEEMPADDAKRLTAFLAGLERLRGLAAVSRLDELLAATLAEFGYDVDTLLRDGGARRLANTRKLARLAEEYEAHEGRDLRGFLDAVQARAAATDREPEAPTESEGHDGVRVMTVHSAKGLEFDVVAAADLGRSLIAGGARPDVRLGFTEEERGAATANRVGVRIARAGRPPTTVGELQDLEDAASAAEAAEGRRLTYVAVSRARRRLLLSGLFSPDDLEKREEMPLSASALAHLLPRLGVTPEAQSVSIAAPQPRPGLSASYSPVEISVTVNGPEQAQIGAAVERFDAESQPSSPIAGTPPLLPPVSPDPAAERHLSYAALADYRACGYRYYVERVLGIRAGRSADEATETESIGTEQEQPRVSSSERSQPSARALRLGFGNAVHSLLERSVRSRWSAPSEAAIATALRREGLAATDAEVERVESMIGGWLSSALLTELRGPGSRARPEVSFLLQAPEDTIVRGTIDLLVERPTEPPLFLDYKTDALEGIPPDGREALVEERYEVQRGLYALAVAEATGSEEIGYAYVFLERPSEPLTGSLDTSDLELARARLHADIRGVQTGEFTVTGAPHAGLCFDCPARERLCSYGPDRTLGPAPEPANAR